MIIYEAPHHLKVALADLYETLGDRKMAICRELTKRFEEVIPTTLKAAIDYYNENDPRGEYVMVIEGRSLSDQKKEKQQEWLSMSIEEHMEYYESQGVSHKDAMKKVAQDRGMQKREIYQALLNNKNS